MEEVLPLPLFVNILNSEQKLHLLIEPTCSNRFSVQFPK